MNIVLHKRFSKIATKLSAKNKLKMVERITLFAQNPTDSKLRNHPLNTPHKGNNSINITGYIRAIYQLIDDETALFTHIGPHSQLYR